MFARQKSIQTKKTHCFSPGADFDQHSKAVKQKEPALRRIQSSSEEYISCISTGSEVSAISKKSNNKSSAGGKDQKNKTKKHKPNTPTQPGKKHKSSSIINAIFKHFFLSFFLPIVFYISKNAPRISCPPSDPLQRWLQPPTARQSRRAAPHVPPSEEPKASRRAGPAGRMEGRWYLEETELRTMETNDLLLFI